MQRRLIDHRAGEQRLAVVVQRDGQAPKLVRPVRTHMPLNPDVVDRRLVQVGLCGVLM